MEILDDQGRIFGLINVVDAFAVVVVLAVLIAGITLVDPFAEGPTTNAGNTTSVRYATFDLGAQPTYVASVIHEGDVAVLDGSSDTLTVEDVYVSPKGPDQVWVRLRGEIAGAAAAKHAGLALDGTPIRRGTEIRIATNQYEVTGTVTALDESATEFPASTMPVVLETTVPAQIAESVTVGDTATAAGSTVASIESLTVYPTNESNRRHLVLGVDLAVYRVDGVPRFGGATVRRGTFLDFETDEYALNGTVSAIGSTDPPIEPTTRSIQVEVAKIDPSVAESLHTGLTETIRGTTHAEVTGVSVRPAAIVVTSSDGRVYRRDHPTDKAATLTLRVRARSGPDGLRFHGHPLRVGSRVTFDFRTVTVEGTVVSIDD